MWNPGHWFNSVTQEINKLPLSNIPQAAGAPNFQSSGGAHSWDPFRKRAVVETADVVPIEARDDSAPSFTAEQFTQSVLDQHNYWRAQYGAGPLEWSQPQADAAQTWVDKCNWGHSLGAVGSYGENIAAGQVDMTEVLSDWVTGSDEASSYNPSNPVASHFTQVVWKSAKYVGCAWKVCPGISGLPQPYPVYYVCEYDAGNLYPAENFVQNVGDKVASTATSTKRSVLFKKDEHNNGAAHL